MPSPLKQPPSRSEQSTGAASPDYIDEELAVLVHHIDADHLLEQDVRLSRSAQQPPTLQSPPPQDPFHQHPASALPESPDRKELFRLGFRNYDVVSLHLDHDRTVRRYDLCLAIAERRQDPNVEGGIGEELKQPLATCMDA